MQVQIDAHRMILAYGTFTADAVESGIQIVDIDDDQIAALGALGVKHLDEDGIVAITAPSPHIAAAVHAALMEQKAQTAADHALIRQAATPGTEITNAHFAAVARQLGILT